ncbi:hypothetical protein ASE74_18135 [Pedobacter sp. Leaf216]|uniref:DUF6055 domain-containing protein n=1 Tax=Pedobacter sp. Leaf216 TaxID=1735684 RepID=UPI0006F806D6|nr:DUF6055 domain-containing protein [Pedobacter sp. Leaf216]KQM77177.1 hypothetical protein ASE74_18135 [Pedobacter sp. Leaf216]
MLYKLKHTISPTLAFLLFVLPLIGNAQKKEIAKKVFIPKNVNKVPENNNFEDNNSVFSNKRRVESANVVIFWSKELGDDPMQNTDTAKRFDVKRSLLETERFYNYYIDKLKVLKKGHSVSDRYKALVFIYGGNEGTAYGGGQDSVAILWTPAVRVHQFPYGVLAHELGHTFQYMANKDRGTSFHGAVDEMGSQYLLWQVYPNWVDFENFHLMAFLKQTNLAFLHPDNQYHSPFLLEYWSEKHGLDFYGKLLNGLNPGEDPVMTYKRLNNIDQEKFNDEIFDASRKFITWDLKRVNEVAGKYANKHKTIFNPLVNDWYTISKKDCLQSYGYNGIRLKLPVSNTIKLHFKGLTDVEGFQVINPENAGWRYGFLAVKENGDRVYGKMYSTKDGICTFKVPSKTAYLWLVVSAAPKVHTKLPRKPDLIGQWPYQIKLSGTDLY